MNAEVWEAIGRGLLCGLPLAAVEIALLSLFGDRLFKWIATRWVIRGASRFIRVQGRILCARLFSDKPLTLRRRFAGRMASWFMFRTYPQLRTVCDEAAVGLSEMLAKMIIADLRKNSTCPNVFSGWSEAEDWLVHSSRDRASDLAFSAALLSIALVPKVVVPPGFRLSEAIGVLFGSKTAEVARAACADAMEEWVRVEAAGKARLSDWVRVRTTLIVLSNVAQHLGFAFLDIIKRIVLGPQV